MDIEKETTTPKVKKSKISKKKKKKLKAYDLLNKFFKKTSNDLKKVYKNITVETLTFALDLTGNINIIDENLYNDLETLKNLEGYKALHKTCKDLNKKIKIDVARKIFGVPNVGSNASYVPKIKIDLTAAYDTASFDEINIIEDTGSDAPYKRKKKKN